MRRARIESLLEKLKSVMIDRYQGRQVAVELLIDIYYERCRRADHDHHKDHRIYMHVGCEDNRICTCSSITNLDDENLYGLFAHEIGHIIMTQFHQIYEEVLDENEIVGLYSSEDEEIMADEVIAVLFDLDIRYDENKVQWLRLP